LRLKCCILEENPKNNISGSNPDSGYPAKIYRFQKIVIGTLSKKLKEICSFFENKTLGRSLQNSSFIHEWISSLSLSQPGSMLLHLPGWSEGHELLAGVGSTQRRALGLCVE